MEDLKNKYAHIPGWGIDADPENEPNYPYKHWTGDDHKRLDWERPAQQVATVEILHSNERPNLSATFGTPCPPKGVSGAIRRFAFKFSESEYGHWLSLLLADRINMIEGLVEDMSKGKMPNIYVERGWRAIVKHDKVLAAKKVAFAALTVAAVVALMNRNKIKRRLS